MTGTHQVLSISAFALLLGCSPGNFEDSKHSHNSAQRVVVIGDIHADIGAAREAFRIAGGTDENSNWIGGDLIIVQLGDFIGRSYEDREVIEFILAVRKGAETAGGKVHVLIGNHEVFGARSELRWVPDSAYAAFDGIPGLDLDNPLIAHLPVSRRARSAALMPGGLFARQLAEFPAVLRLGDTIFVHGGVTPHWAAYGIARINEEVSQWFAGESDQPLSARGMDPGHFDDSVMMSRHFSEDVDEDDCAMLEESLRILGAKRMIVGHSVQKSITARCDEKVWAVDVGMSRYYGGNLQVLDIIDDEKISIISP
ncbi:MAG: metallophosphoesterase [Woeseiaceae bacterium]|nr:metallophosphoesterase [Woeseiaceae bacterium]